MFVRAIALFLALVIAIGTVIPLATQNAQAESRPKRHRHAKRYKKYSKGWWRQYRARMKRRHALAAAKRSLRLRQLRLAQAHTDEKALAAGKPVSKTGASATKKVVATAPASLPTGAAVPGGWKGSQPPTAELQFRVDNSAGDQIGSASISVVGPASPNRVEGSRRNVGGVPTTKLRSNVIDRMIKENGWVVNDYQQEIGGQPVYVVVAQSQAKNGGVESRMFYFTEVDGVIYSVVTNSPVQETEHLAEESEKVINSLRNRVRPTQRASVKP